MILPPAGDGARDPEAANLLLDEIRALLSERCGAFRAELGEVRRTLNDAVLQLQRGFEGMAEQIAARDRLLQELIAFMLPAGEANGAEHGLDSFTAEATHVLASFAERSTDSARDMLERLRAVSTMLTQLGAVSDGIERLSSQTRFLSLNAAIEAARAGDRFPAFAAIADQVERLSTETANLNRGIESGITRTQEELRHVTSIASQVSSDFEQHAEGPVRALQAQADELRSYIAASASAAAELRERVAVSVTALQLDDVVGQMLGRLDEQASRLEPFASELLRLAGEAARVPEQDAAAAAAAATQIRGAMRAARERAGTAASGAGQGFRAGTVELF